MMGSEYVPEVPVPDPDESRLDETAQKLMEHFDTVHIFATRVDEDRMTTFVSRGRGNYCARVGQIILWADRERDLHKRGDNE